MIRRIHTSLVLLSLAAACGGGDGVSGGQALRSALQDAEPGEAVVVAAGRFEGPYQVPAGVRLRGQGRGRTRIVGPSDMPALRLEPGAQQPTVLEGVTVQAGGGFGVASIGAGRVELRQVDVRAEAGAAAGFDGASQVHLVDVSLQGPVTAEGAESVDPAPSPADVATHGLVLLRVGTAELERVQVRGFADVGVLSVDSAVSWTGGTVAENLGTGLLADGGELDLTQVELEQALQGVRLLPAYNAVFAGQARVATDGLISSRSEGFGLLHAGAAGSHAGLEARGNESAAVWIQDSAGVELRDAVLQDNALAGVAAIDSSDLRLEDVEVRGTRAMQRIYDGAAVDVGDGVHLLRSVTDVQLFDSVLADNARVGVLLDAGTATPDGLALRNVRVRGSGDQLGAVAQGGAVPSSWDEGVTRLGEAATNDGMLEERLETLRIVGPSDLPLADTVAEGGLGSITGPSD
jgi:hypothetical protein